MAARVVYIDVVGSASLKLTLKKDVPARKVWASLRKARRVDAATHVLETRDGALLGLDDLVLASAPGAGDALLVCRPRPPGPPPRPPPPAAPRRGPRPAPAGSALARGFLGGAPRPRPPPEPAAVVPRAADLPPPAAISGIFDAATLADVARQEAAHLARELDGGAGDRVARELLDYRLGRPLSQAARQHAALLDGQGVAVLPGPPPRLEERTALSSLHELMRGMRGRLEERQGDLNPGRDAAVELELCGRVFTLGMNCLLATSRAGGARDSARETTAGSVRGVPTELVNALAPSHRRRFGRCLDESIALVERSKHGERARVETAADARVEVASRI